MKQHDDNSFPLYPFTLVVPLCAENSRRPPTPFMALGNDDRQIVGQHRSRLTERPGSVFLSATASDPEE